MTLHTKYTGRRRNDLSVHAQARWTRRRRDRARPKKSSPETALNRKVLCRKSQKIPIPHPRLASPIPHAAPFPRSTRALNTLEGGNLFGRTQASGRRLRPELGRLLEGQKVLVMQCSTKGCGHYAASSADACVMEEARVQPPIVWLAMGGRVI